MERFNLESFPELMHEYRIQLQKGSIQKAYKGLMDYIMDLKTMDMTYFSINPKSLKDRNLKIALVFIHESIRFEVWLAGANKQVQSEYWEMIKESRWDQYHLVPSTKGADSILEHVLADNPDFSDLDGLTKQIELGTLKFIADVERFLSER
jgi:hypothetical protein